MHHLNAALRAHNLFFRDRHYVVQDGEVIIVDEFTGRLMPGRRWSDGLHQAIEAKENVSIQSENQTLASITFQNYFRMYRKLAGMTGTADTEAYEFQEIYGLEVVVVPTHMPMIRADRNDQVFRTAAEKYKAIIGDIKDCHERGQPVLVGTTSIENSELIALLPVARGPVAADLRRRTGQRDHAAPGHAGGRADRAWPRYPIDRERAAQGRGAQFRHPQATAGIRQRRQRPTSRNLSVEEFHPRIAGRLGPDRGAARGRGDRFLPRPCPRREHGGAMGHSRPGKSVRCRAPARSTAVEVARERPGPG